MFTHNQLAALPPASKGIAIMIAHHHSFYNGLSADTAVFHHGSSYEKRLKPHGLNLSTDIRIKRLLIKSVFLVELVNASACLTALLLSRIERMALGADLHVDTLRCRSCLKCITAVAGHSRFLILRMNAFSHFLSPLFILSVFHSIAILSQRFTVCNKNFQEYIEIFLLIQKGNNIISNIV